MTRKPNLLFIFTDQQRADTLGCYGNPLVRTPNLDRLAGEGCLFENAYVTQPVCTPSRSSIMTGLYPHTTGCVENNIPLKQETKTIAEMVSSDYVCGYYGKWHLGDEVVPQHGFADWVSIEDNYRQYYSKQEYLSHLSTYHQFLVEHGFEPDRRKFGAMVFDRVTAAKLPEEFTKARFLGREAARFIRENRDNPFVLYVNFLEPHRPYWGPFDDMYPLEDLPVGPSFLEMPSEDAARINRMIAGRWRCRAEYDGEDFTTEAGWRKTRSKYLGNVTLVDRAVGQILQALEETGLTDDTVVVFTSDHGEMAGDHHLLQKTVLYEEAVKVPLIVRVPWLSKQPHRVKARISQIDLVPTLLDLLGEPIPEELQGTSLVAVLQGKGTLRNHEGADVYVEWNGIDGRPVKGSFHDVPVDAREIQYGPWRTVISPEGWKLNLSPVDQCELYDLNSDPYERKNLFNNPNQRDRIHDLARRIRRWQECTDDRAPLPDL